MSQDRRPLKFGRNTPCWCGSGNKYKRCHLERERYSPLSFEEILREQKSAAGLRLCLAKGIDTKPCRGGIVNAHSLSRKASLERIAANKHVYGFKGSFIDRVRGGSWPPPRLIGVRDASTFTGFCAGHDSDLFRPVDAEPLIPTVEQVWLLAYRTLCREIVGDLVLGRQVPMMRKLDRGWPLWKQMVTQINVDKIAGHVDRVVPDLVSQQKKWHEIMTLRAYDRVSYALIRFQSTPEVICSGVSQPSRDFTDRDLLDLYDPDSRQDSVAFALIPGETYGFAFFAWLDDFKEAEEFVQSLLELPDIRIVNQLVRYAFETFSNVWLSPLWWEALPTPEKDFLVERMYTGNVPYRESQDPYSLADNGMTFVSWNIENVERVFNGKRV